YQAALNFEADIIVRITADDPLKDPALVDCITREVVDDAELDYASNSLEPTYPLGLDVEAFTIEAIARAWREASSPWEREHVTPYIWSRPGAFRLRNIAAPTNLSNLRWTVDYEEDLCFVRAIYNRLNDRGVFGINEILDVLEQEPWLTAI